MTGKSKVLHRQALEQMVELSRHPVLSRYWKHISLVLKGSTARGNADRYSDVDLVFYASEPIKKAIVSGYRRRGWCTRSDGIFMFIPNGHYHVETFAQLRRYYETNDFLHCWECQHSIPLSDPGSRFAQTVKAGQRRLFRDPTAVIKKAYLDLQLHLDWMRMPIIRADRVSTFLHAAKITQGVCQMAYLLDGKSYPPDKWLACYLHTTRFGRSHAVPIRKYLRLIPKVTKLKKHRSFTAHPLYKEAGAFIGGIARFIKRNHGHFPWIDCWYNFV